LISAVLDRPALVGVGIDEATAVVVQDGTFEVVGRSSVVVVDARAGTTRAEKGRPSSGTDLKLSVLTAGMRYTLR
jgi:cyanophycinase